jgi:hypothetical protein
VAFDVPRLPALCELHLTKCFAGDGGELSAAAWEGIAASCSALRLLHLGGLTLPANMPQALSQLTGLTCLRLRSLYKRVPSLSALTALTNLKELCFALGGFRSGLADSVLPCRLLAGLRSLDTLALSHCSFVDGPYTEQLCASVPQLTSLDLSCNGDVGTGLSALRRLTNLQVLGLEGVAAHDVQHMRVPASLQRCYLGWGRWPEERVAAKGLLGRGVEAVFDRWGRWL